MIHCKNIRFSYPDEQFVLAVNDLRIDASDRVAVIGPSGGGKTTFIHLLAGILTPNEGSISLDDLNLNDFKPSELQDIRIAKMGLVFQEFKLIEYLSVYENILLPFRINAVLKMNEIVKSRAKELAEMVGLGAKLHKFPNKMSQGERQRIALCRALISEPSVLFCDEPTANLDQVNRDIIMEVLIKYAEKNNIPLVVVTHDPELLSLFNRIIDIKDLIL